ERGTSGRWANRNTCDAEERIPFGVAQRIRNLDRASDPLAAVLSMCEAGRAALVQAASVVEAKEVLSAISTLEHAVKIRDMNQEAAVAASTLRIRAERRVGELLAQQAESKERQTRGGN